MTEKAPSMLTAPLNRKLSRTVQEIGSVARVEVRGMAHLQKATNTFV